MIYPPQYKVSIPGRADIIAFIRAQSEAPTVNQIVEGLKLEDPEQIPAIRKRIDAMVRDGQLLRTDEGRFRPFHYTADMAISEAINEFGLPEAWPDEVLKQAANIQDEIPPAEIQKRLDLRQLPLVTIDGADAKDFDDAVYCEPHENGWRIIVAIADVSYYVPLGSALDIEALNRGTSVYFPDFVVPMLPKKLSNGLCSLVPGEDRLCMAAELIIDQKGQLKKTSFSPAVMHSHARLTYDQVQAYLDNTAELPNPNVAKHIDDLHAAYQVLLAERNKRGALDFDVAETFVALDQQGVVTEVKARNRITAHRIIEECMLLTNKAVAEFIEAKHASTLFRVHITPDSERMENLRQYLSFAGITLGGGSTPSGQDLNVALHKAQHRPDINIIEMMILRSMNQAVYTPDNQGHFGLAYASYVQFTSPIRRYPDLIAHRVLRHILDSKDTHAHRYGETLLAELGDETSMTERRAEDASRLVAQKLKCAYMFDKIGSIYEGIISGVTNFGFFVTLTECLVDGLVHVRFLSDDFYHFDAVSHQLVGEVTKKAFKQGDPVTVKVAKVDLIDGKIDFSLDPPLNPIRPIPSSRGGKNAKKHKKNKALDAIKKQKRAKLAKLRLKKGRRKS